MENNSVWKAVLSKILFFYWFGSWLKNIFWASSHFIILCCEWTVIKTMSKLLKGTFVELSNLRRKKAMSINFDSWFTYCVLCQQKSVSVEFKRWTTWPKKIQFGSQKMHLTPPPPLLLLKGLCRYYAGKKTRNWKINERCWKLRETFPKKLTSTTKRSKNWLRRSTETKIITTVRIGNRCKIYQTVSPRR